MNFSRLFFILSFTAALVFGQSASKNEPSGQLKQFATVVQSLYKNLVARQPSGTVKDTEMKDYLPYLSEGLRHKFDLSRACLADWKQQSPYPKLTEGMNSDAMAFTGIGNTPASFQIEKTIPQKDGSLRVYVKLTFKLPKYPPWSKRVAAVMIQESGQFFVDDVIYINDSDWVDHPEDKPADRRLSGYLFAGCDGAHWIGSSLPNEPTALAQGLNQQVVARHPLDIPSGEDWKVFAPYLGKTLLKRIDDYGACMEDQDRRFGAPDLKPPGLIEDGIFSGGNEEADPRSFRVERSEQRKDGSVRVYVRFRWEEPHDKPYFWRVADVFIQEDGRYLLDNVIILKDENHPAEARLSKLLANGCDGRRWVGYPHEK
ncbi:MAG: hypothetical protein ABSE51_02715 [Terracidiphilus sp.]|jgi:hypothetical protein